MTNVKSINSKQSQTPKKVSIKPQRMGFEFNDKIPKYWLYENVLFTHTLNALSILFPKGEQFFVDSVRSHQKQITDKKLKSEIRGFIGQEAMHSLEHVAMNNYVKSLGFPVDSMEKDLEVVLNIVKKFPKRHQLAITCALEHITAMMADMLLERDDVRVNMHESIRPLWVWHAIEETEHKSVAFDVYQECGGNYVERSAYLIMSTIALGIMASWFTGRILIKDRKNLSIKDTLFGLNKMWGIKGTFSSLIPTWFEYFKPGFHPWDDDNSDLIESFKKEIQEYISPEYKYGNRGKTKTA